MAADDGNFVELSGASGPAPGRFIPFRRADLVDVLADERQLDAADQDRFRALSELLDATFHVEFRSRLEALKDAYAPFAHDPDTRVVRRYDAEQRADAKRALTDGLERLLGDANFTRVSLEEIHAAFAAESLLSLRAEVDLEDFDEVLVYRRGQTSRERERREWKGLRRRTVEFTNYEKVLIFVAFKDAEHFTARERDLDELPFDPGSIVIKLFQDVPRADIEMLFPNTQVRMRTVDKLLIGVPAVVSGIIILVTRLAATLGLVLLLMGFWLGVRDEPVELDQATLVSLGAGFGALGSYLVRQFTKFKARKLEFTKTLADDLYFRNLDNDAGVFHNLLDSAEQEEVKEALLGWYFLRAADEPLTVAQLDDAVEAWFRDRLGCRLDFEVNDGVAKLRRLGLVEEADERLRAVTAAEALRRLDERWDSVFEYRRDAQY